MKYSLVLDVGTTGVKAFLFDHHLQQIGKAYETYPLHKPKRGWVEQDPKAILTASIRVLRSVTHASKLPMTAIERMGITNQRETIVFWDAKTGTPIYPAIVWQDERTKARCQALAKHHQGDVRKKTGLHLDAYFSASKAEWLMENVPKAKKLLDQDQLRFGTIDTWLMWHLCTNHPHVTDETNAARTLLFNIQTKEWDTDLCTIFHVPMDILPDVKPSISNFGTLLPSIVGRPIPIQAVCGDQQSSFFAAASSTKVSPVTKITYGTGVFLGQSLGSTFKLSENFFTTLVPHGHESAYALEAKICVSGPDVTKRLKNPKALRTYFYELAKKVDTEIKKLPKKPKQLLIDGGSSRDGLILAIQEEVSGISTQPLISYDGTALGIAMMLLK
ncbi:MAG: FGGY family carbohydrate kinase [Candidatus Uhrbacteria bacterium]|nr:FGGY family carbohydrate kinase [Candidatus Uhrbacteria bacterium]